MLSNNHAQDDMRGGMNAGARLSVKVVGMLAYKLHIRLPTVIAFNSYNWFISYNDYKCIYMYI